MDEKDKKIIEMLKEDGRRPFTQIAEQIGVTEATVRKRVKKLEDGGVIERYTVDVDPSKLGYKTVTILGLDVEPEKLIPAAEEITNIEEVKDVYTSSGDHMIMAWIWARDNSHLSKIMFDKIGAIEGVKDLCPSIVLEKLD
ncbi:MAG: Lrp/AsnC family transcriptional regulator [Candidatus Aenigmatarchaeota archaeon]